MSIEDIENELNNGVELNVPILIDDIDFNRTTELRSGSK